MHKSNYFVTREQWSGKCVILRSRVVPAEEMLLSIMKWNPPTT